jgi:hypothetical protein
MRGRVETRWRPKPSPPPPTKKRIHPPKQVDLVKVANIPHDGWSPKSPRDQMWKSHDKCRFGVKVAISPAIPQWVVLARKLFAKYMWGIFIYLTAVSKSACLCPVSCENEYSAYIVNPPLYKLWRGGIQSQSASLQSRGNNSEESRDKQEQSRPHQHTLDSKLFVVYPRKELLNTIYIFNIHLFCGLRLRFKTPVTKEAIRQ